MLSDMRKFKGLVLLFLVICFACNQNNEKYLNAKNLYKVGKSIDALKIIESIDSNKLDYNFKLLKAKILSDLKQYENSIHVLRKINDPKNDSVNSLVAGNYWKMGLQFHQNSYWDSTIFYLKKAIEINGTKFRYHNELAINLHNRSLHAEALTKLYEIKVQFPDSSENLLVDIAKEKYCLGDLSSSLQELLTISQKNKSLDPELYRILSRIYKDRGKLDSSLFYINKTLELNSEFSYHHFEKANLFVLMGMYDSACAYLYKAAEKGLVIEDMIKDICSKTK